jgi:hypothetical protein
VLAAQAWSTIRPGGATRCAFDTPYEFWVREGDPSRVALYLQGGGACWSLDSCDPRGRIAFDATIDSTDYRQRRDGIFDRADKSNPFRDYTSIFVPYCTGDLHLGARVTRYAAPDDSAAASVTVHHAGYYNLRAVMDYVAARRTSPRQITVVGASAGGVAAPFVAGEIARRLPNATVREIADGAGAFRVPRLRALLASWAVDSVMASLGAPLAGSGDVVVGLYKTAAARAPRVRFAQVGTTEDAVVGGWLTRFGDDASNVERYIGESYRELEAAGLCFTGYTVPGKDHTILWRPNALASKVGDRTLGERISREVLDAPCQPQSTPARDAAFLFAYRAKPEMDAAFAEGYKRHLDWHRAHADSLTWLAWTVIDGPSIGTFVDGTFGISFRAFDDRVDQAGDGADATTNVTAFAVPTNRAVFRLRRDLSSGSPLEDGKPGRLQRVTTFVLQPGREAMVEQAFRTLAAKKGESLDYSVYERLSGGEQPAFVVIAQFNAWADLADGGKDPADRIRRAIGSSIVRSETEIWAYRRDLTYFPR